MHTPNKSVLSTGSRGVASHPIAIAPSLNHTALVLAAVSSSEAVRRPPSVCEQALWARLRGWTSYKPKLIRTISNGQKMPLTLQFRLSKSGHSKRPWQDCFQIVETKNV